MAGPRLPQLSTMLLPPQSAPVHVWQLGQGVDLAEEECRKGSYPSVSNLLRQ